MNRILFVDDEPNVMQGLQRVLRPLRHDWEMHFAGSGPEALAGLAQTPCDAVITDMRMPGMNGVVLLTEVRARWPHMARFVLSGQSEPSLLRESVGVAHQFLSKPCDFEILQAAIERIARLKELLPDQELRSIVGQSAGLPCLPSLKARLREHLRTDTESAQGIGQIIAQDMGISAKVLQIVSSAFFGTPRCLVSAEEAVALVGSGTLALLMTREELFPVLPDETVRTWGLCDLWTQSAYAARVARPLAVSAGITGAAVEEVVLAAFLHGVGKLLFAAANNAAERTVLDASHAEAGAYLLGLWGLPDGVVTAVARYPAPGSCPGATVVHEAVAQAHLLTL